MGPQPWDHKADKDLLLAIIAEGQLKGIIWPTVAEKMKVKGYSFSHEACRQHFQKIRKEANGGNSSPTRNVGPKGPKTNGSGSAKSTPRKPKSMTDSFPTSNGSFSNGNSSFAVSDGQGYEDDEEEMMTPLKRKRMMKDESLENDGRSALLFKKDPHQGGKESPIQLEEDDLYDGYA